MRILIVDDESAIREVVSMLLEDQGWVIDTAVNGLEALRKFATAQWDLVITDRAMPEMDGPTLAAAIKSQFPQTKVLLMTGYSAADQSRQLSGIDGVLAKPFTQEQLWEALERVSVFRRGKQGCPKP